MESTQQTIDTTVCDQLVINDSTYTISDTYVQHLENAAGCDSTLTINLTVLESTEGNIQRIVCDEVTINDSTYTESGIYVQHLENAAGCDSTLTIDLTVLESPEDTIYRTACDKYEFDGQLLTESGVYTQVIESGGCEGTLTLVLTISKSTQLSLTRTVCDSYTLNGIRYVRSGIYEQKLTNAAGCDSIITLDLTVRSEDPIVLESEASDLTVECDGLGNTGALESWLASIGTTGAAQVGYGDITWSNNFEALTPGCCNTGSATVTFTATDDCNKTVSTTATFTIIDTTAPTFTAPEDITIYSEENCEYNANPEATGDVIDEADICCTDLNAEYTDVVEQGSCTGGWVITRTWTLSDACGNEAEPQVQIITVMDNTAPTVICKDITVQLDAEGLATITAADIDGGSTDNCGIDTMFISQSEFSCGGLGENEVTLTVVDNCGNTSACTAIVTVESGAANCGNIMAEPDTLEIVVCKNREASGSMNILANDNLLDGNVTISVSDLPEGVQLDLTTGDLDYNSETTIDNSIQFTYKVCHNVYANDCSEALVTINVLIDSDCDNVPDAIDIDDDDDGIVDDDEELNALNKQTLDSDGDGIVDRLDIDSDNDGIPDNIEWQQNIAEGIKYAANGGTDEGYDYYPPLGSDSNGNGWDDQYDDQGVYYAPVDMDLDGIPDYLDEDSDGDGIPDWIEGWDAAPHDTVADTNIGSTDTDGDGLYDPYDSYDTSEEWLHGLNAIGSYAPLQDMAGDVNNIRDWRDDYVRPPVPPKPQASIIFIPDGFSPNMDNYNDYFQIVMKDEAGTIYDIFGETFPDAKIEIYNRWGNLIYEKANYGNYTKWGTAKAWWDGTSMHDMQLGKDQLPTATYFYILYFNNGTNDPVTGSIFLNN